MQLQKQIQKQKNWCIPWNNLVPAGWLSGTDWDRERLHLQAGFWSWFHVWGLSDDRSARNPWIWRSLNVDSRWSYTAEQVLHGTPSGGKPNHILQKQPKPALAQYCLGQQRILSSPHVQESTTVWPPMEGWWHTEQESCSPFRCLSQCLFVSLKKKEVLPNIFYTDFGYQDLAGLQVLLTNTGVARNTKALVQRWDKYDFVHSLIFSLFPYPKWESLTFTFLSD